MQSKSFNKLNLNYRIFGANRRGGLQAPYPLVFLHGLMGYASNWGKIWSAFETERDVLVLDQRGHGKSEKPAAGYSPSDYAQDILLLLEEIGWQRAHIVGHSMGGRNAMQFVHDYPERAVSLILEDTGPDARPDRAEWVRRLLGRIPMPFPDRESAKKYFDATFVNDPLLGGFLHANIERDSKGTFSWRFSPSAMIESIELGRAQDASELFRKIKRPTLVIRGEQSEEFTQDEADRMRALQPDMELLVIRKAGHFVHSTHPLEFTAALREFIAKVESKN